MQILIELKLPYSFSSGILEAGKMRLCDGKEPVMVSPTDFYLWHPNYIVGRISDIVQSVDLLNGGNIANFETFNFSIIDDNLLSSVEGANHSLNSAKVSLYTWDGTTKAPLWFGYAVDTSLDNNILTFNCENLTKGLKVLSNPVAYGENTKIQLSVDSTIPKNKLKFVYNSIESIHCKLKKATTPKISGANYFNKGIELAKSDDTTLTIWHDNSPFEGLDATKLKLTFESGTNSGSSFQIKSIITIPSEGHFMSVVFLAQDFEDIDLSTFDRVSISENTYYFKLPEGFTNDSISKVNVKIDDIFYDVSQHDRTIQTIAGNQYLLITPRYSVYKEIPITSSYFSCEDPTNKNMSGINSSNIFDGDLSNNTTFSYGTLADITTWFQYSLSFFPNFPDNLKSDIVFGGQYRGNIGYGNMVTFDFYINTVLKTGEIYPNNNDGTINRSTPFKTCVCVGNEIPTLNSSPLGDNTYPSLTGNPLMVYSNGTTEDPKLFFDKNEMVKLEIDPSAYKDISHFILTVKASYRNAPVSLNSIGSQFWFKAGIYTASEIDDLSEIYIDTDGKLGYITAFGGLGPSILSSNDAIAKDILTSMGNTVEPDFNYSIYQHNHFFADSRTPSSEAIATLSKEGLFVTGSSGDGDIYSKPLIVHTNDANVDYSINSTFIQEITQPLQDIDISELINMPKIVFNDYSGNSEYMEVIALDLEFPTLASIQESVNNFAKVFSFSENILTILIDSSSIETVYDFLKQIWDYCKESYTKNLIDNQGEIKIETIALETVLTNIDAKAKILSLVQLNSQRRKRITVTLPIFYGTVWPMKLGSRIKIHHPKVLQDNSLYGFLERVAINVFEAETKITLILDAMKLGNGNVESF